VKRGLLVLILPLAAAAWLAVTAPAAGPSTVVIADGVSVSGLPVGGLTSEPARALLRTAFSAPLVLRFEGRSWSVSPQELGAVGGVDGAVSDALGARPGENVRLNVYVRKAPVREYVAGLAKRFGSKATDAKVTFAGTVPRITRDRPGFAVRRRDMQAAIVAALETARRASLPLIVRTVRPKVTKADFGPVIVIHRGSNRLFFYEGEKLARIIPVATGQARYPTPLGVFSVVDLQRNPWWRPPDSDWARGKQPIPPGPGNPLGTRWMGLSAPGVGMHGTPDAASIGYSVSHGCIRMHISDAEWLFNQVTWGTPVAIVSA
jgi:lipoprotein-anchoring transpeptidase ErfK/SrfK